MVWKLANSNGNGQLPNAERLFLKKGRNIEIDLVIEKGVTIPPKRSIRNEKPRNPFNQLLLDLEVGDSVEIPHKIAQEVRRQIQYTTKTHPIRKYATRKTQVGSLAFRVWRVH